MIGSQGRFSAPKKNFAKYRSFHDRRCARSALKFTLADLVLQRTLWPTAIAPSNQVLSSFDEALAIAPSNQVLSSYDGALAIASSEQVLSLFFLYAAHVLYTLHGGLLSW